MVAELAGGAVARNVAISPGLWRQALIESAGAEPVPAGWGPHPGAGHSTHVDHLGGGANDSTHVDTLGGGADDSLME